MKTLLAVLVGTCAVACGPRSQPATLAPTHAQPDDDEVTAAELGPFHDVMAPRWHSAKGPQRMQDTCAGISELAAGAEQIPRSLPYGVVAAKWTAGSEALAEAVTALGATCEANDAAAFEPAFERVHASFRVLLVVGSHRVYEDPVNRPALAGGRR